jgi:YbbR domain-containing protein
MKSSLVSRLGELFAENLALKLLSFGFAIGLYTFIHGAQDAQRTFRVEVVARTPPEAAGRILMTTLPSTVAVTVRGPRALLDDLRSDDLGSLQLDLHTGKLEQLELDPALIRTPPGVHAEQVDPPILDLRWEDETTREIPIQASLTGQPAAGYVVKSAPEVEPRVLHARGPRSAVQVIQVVRVDPFDVTGLSAEGTTSPRSLALDRPPPRVSFDVSMAQVKVTVAREEIDRLFSKIPVQVVGAGRAGAQPSEVDVRVQGPPDIVRALRPDQIIPAVDLPAGGVNLAVSGSAKLPVAVELEHCKTVVLPQSVIVKWNAETAGARGNK